MEETTVNFPSQSVHVYIWDSGVPKIDLMALDWCLGSERKCSYSLRSSLAIVALWGAEQATVAAAAAMIHLTSRNILNPSDWLSNKSQHSQLLIDYIFQEHDKRGCFQWWMIVFCNPLPGWVHMATTGQAIAYITFDSNCSCSVHFPLNSTS